jgi:hypothetical protein
VHCGEGSGQYGASLHHAGHAAAGDHRQGPLEKRGQIERNGGHRQDARHNRNGNRYDIEKVVDDGYVIGRNFKSRGREQRQNVSGDLKMYFIRRFENDVLEPSVFFPEKL